MLTVGSSNPPLSFKRIKRPLAFSPQGLTIVWKEKISHRWAMHCFPSLPSDRYLDRFPGSLAPTACAIAIEFGLAELHSAHQDSLSSKLGLTLVVTERYSRFWSFQGFRLSVFPLLLPSFGSRYLLVKACSRDLRFWLRVPSYSCLAGIDPPIFRVLNFQYSFWFEIGNPIF